MTYNYNTIVESILSGNASAVRGQVKDALSQGSDPVEVITRGLVAAMDSVGSRFEQNQIYVTELLVTARAMHAGLEELRPYMAATNTPPAGRVLLGTVAGDLHDIGKNMLGLLLEASGFEVIDLGIDVSPARFVEAVVKHRPQVLCMSALLSTTVSAMGDTTEALREAGLRDQVKVIVGGAALTQELARKVRADAYAPDAITGIQVIKKMVESQESIPSPVVLETVFSGSTLEELQDAFSSLIGLHLIVVDSWGQPLSTVGRFPECSGYCEKASKFLNNKVGSNRYDTIPLWKGLKDAFAYRCYAGLIEISYPLIADVGKVGAIICGHFLMEDDCPPGERPEGLTILTPERLEMVCKLLAFIGGRITDLSQVLLSNRQLEEQRAHFLHFMQRQHQLEEALRDAELKALQSQVNPHFMFNALNVIARLALLQKDFQTERVVGALARLMRYSLYQVKVMVTVREEVKAVQDYLLIQKARFQGRIDSSVEVDEKVLEAKMPCMILQPLVENACLHGLEPLKQGGTIKVRGWMENSQVCFQIEDNGVGMSEQLKKDIFHMQVKSDSRGQVSGLGLANVLRRMQYQFGSSCALDINSSPGKGTCLKLSFPYQTGEGASD
ncbi:MAG: histidine kinase [Bacillota bacterium]|jgi:methylmalonyl-CoA mutase cobalamin-binding domain/chain